MTETDYRKLEPALEGDILSKYDLIEGPVIWHSHDNIGLDDVAHYFTMGSQKYVLVWSDFSNLTFIHEERLPPVRVHGGKDEWLHISDGVLSGDYSLYLDTPAR